MSKVLLIEDDFMQREIAKDHLESKMHNVEEHTSVDAFFEKYGYDEKSGKFTKLPVDIHDMVVVTDNNTNTTKRGIDVVAALKGSGVPVVLITSDDTNLGVNANIVQEKGGPTAAFVRKGDPETFNNLDKEMLKVVVHAEGKNLAVVIDDEPMGKAYNTSHLSKMNFHVIAFDDHDEALKYLGYNNESRKVAFKPDLIVTDRMKGNDAYGDEVLKIAKNNGLRSVMMTADTMDIKYIKEIGGSQAELENKPTTLNDFKNVVERAMTAKIEKPRSEQTVLILEDEPEKMKTHIESFEKMGFKNFITGTSVEEGLKHLQYDEKTGKVGNPVDFILTDRNMVGDTKGEYMLGVAKENGLKIAMATSGGTKEADVKRINPDAGWIKKPYIHDEFANMVEKVLDPNFVSKEEAAAKAVPTEGKVNSVIGLLQKLNPFRKG